MKTPLNKRAAAPLPPDVEQMLRASAAWEPDAAMPSDFAAFARQALEKRERKATVRWANGLLRSPLAVGLASVCVLWAGGRLNAPDEAALNAAPAYAAAVSAASLGSVEGNSRFSSPGLVLAASEEGEDVPQLTSARFSNYPAAVADHSNRVGRRNYHQRSKHNAHRLEGVETVAVDKVSMAAKGKAIASASLWETETVERPAWGALVPVPTDAQCAVPADTAAAEGVETSEPRDDEATPVLMPVLDVTLPDVEPPMPTASPTPSPEASK